MRTLLATALLLGISSLTGARAEWEILDPGTAVGPTAPVVANTLSNPLPADQVKLADAFLSVNPLPGGVGGQPY